MLEDKKILIGITGSIAAFKIPSLIRLLIKEGASVQVILTPEACNFVTPLTISTLSKHRAIIDMFEKESGEWNSHVELGNWADLMLIAPATANTISKMASGQADNLLLCTFMAARCPIFFAPAMDVDMYQHPTTQANIRKLQEMGLHLIEPQTGELASGLTGTGRLEEPEAIISILDDFFKKKTQLKDKKILITAGPTREPIDPVRYISNHSSGLMGFALAEKAADMGAHVTLITGPVNLEITHQNIRRINVETAQQMAETTLHHFAESDITIMAAAVADFSPFQPFLEKIKKHEQETLVLRLKPTMDILAEMGSRKKDNQILVGFALETNNEKDNALEKLKNKKADIIVLNSTRDKGATFGSPNNRVTIFHKNGDMAESELRPKKEIAQMILDFIIQHF